MLTESMQRVLDAAIAACEADSDLRSVLIIPDWHPRITSFPEPVAHWVCADGGVQNPQIEMLVGTLNSTHQSACVLHELLTLRLQDLVSRINQTRRELELLPKLNNVVGAVARGAPDSSARGDNGDNSPTKSEAQCAS